MNLLAYLLVKKGIFHSSRQYTQLLLVDFFTISHYERMLGVIKHVAGDNNRERKCADTVGTVLVTWAGHFQC